MRTTEKVTKIILKDLGDAKAVKKSSDNALELGAIIGLVDGVITRTMPNMTKSYGLSGTFEAIPADETLNIMRSGIVFLPDAIMEMITSYFLDADGENVKTPPVVQIGFVVSSQKATNRDGYAYSFSALTDISPIDPLKGLRASYVDTDGVGEETSSGEETGAGEGAGADNVKPIAKGKKAA